MQTWKPKKLYCKNCKYYSIGCYKIVGKKWSEIVGKFKPVFLKYGANENNDCRHYKKFWWKFWI